MYFLSCEEIKTFNSIQLVTKLQTHIKQGNLLIAI